MGTLAEEVGVGSCEALGDGEARATAVEAEVGVDVPDDPQPARRIAAPRAVQPKTRRRQTFTEDSSEPACGR